MKNCICWAGLAQMLALLPLLADAPELRADPWGQATNHVQMLIGLNESGTEIRANQPISLRIRIRNVATNETFFLACTRTPNSDPIYGIGLHVISPSGKDVSPRLGKDIGLSSATLSVAPNRTTEFDFELSQVVKLSSVGTYQITVTKTLSSGDEQKHFAVTSNTLKLTVVPGRWKPDSALTNNFTGKW